MRNNMGKMLLCSLVFCLCIGVASSAAPPTALELEVNGAIALAIEHNLDFRIVALDWQQAQGNLERAQIVGDDEMIAEAEKAWQKSQKYYQESKQDLSSLVRNTYQELLESETTLANKGIAKDRADAQLKIDQSKYKAGLLSTLDIQRAENSLFAAEHSYSMAAINLETQRMKFNQLLGLDFDLEVVLTERLLLDFVPFNLELEECYLLALEVDSGVLAAREELHKAKETVLVAQSPFTPRVELERALINEEKTKIKLQQAEQNLYFMIRGEYYNLVSQTHGLQMKKAEIELEQKMLQAEESKYAAGVLSNAQIVAQQEKLAQLEQGYSTELLQYSLARLKMLQAIGRPEVSWGNDHEN